MPYISSYKKGHKVITYKNKKRQYSLFIYLFILTVEKKRHNIVISQYMHNFASWLVKHPLNFTAPNRTFPSQN